MTIRKKGKFIERIAELADITHADAEAVFYTALPRYFEEEFKKGCDAFIPQILKLRAVLFKGAPERVGVNNLKGGKPVIYKAREDAIKLQVTAYEVMKSVMPTVENHIPPTKYSQDDSKEK